jgi:hypothetical protein
MGAFRFHNIELSFGEIVLFRHASPGVTLSKTYFHTISVLMDPIKKIIQEQNINFPGYLFSNIIPTW